MTTPSARLARRRQDQCVSKRDESSSSSSSSSKGSSLAANFVLLGSPKDKTKSPDCACGLLEQKIGAICIAASNKSHGQPNRTKDEVKGLGLSALEKTRALRLKVGRAPDMSVSRKVSRANFTVQFNVQDARRRRNDGGSSESGGGGGGGARPRTKTAQEPKANRRAAGGGASAKGKPSKTAEASQKHDPRESEGNERQRKCRGPEQATAHTPQRSLNQKRATD